MILQKLLGRQIIVRGNTGRMYPWGNSYQVDQARVLTIWGTRDTVGSGQATP